MSASFDDKDLQQSVLDELDFEPSIDCSHIGVTATDGIVTLTGHVPTYAQKTAAERAVWRVRGVRAVVQKVDVHYRSDAPTDEEIAKRALVVLRWDSTVPDSVHVKVADGWVTLEGEVDWQYQRTNAERGLRRLEGIRGIHNVITLRPRVTPAQVRERIVGALRRSAEVEANGIRVDVRDGGTITLEGRVDNWAERAAVEQAVWSAPGVKSVVDRLVIA